jgi:hypothetical protein
MLSVFGKEREEVKPQIETVEAMLIDGFGFAMADLTMVELVPISSWKIGGIGRL